MKLVGYLIRHCPFGILIAYIRQPFAVSSEATIQKCALAGNSNPFFFFLLYVWLYDFFLDERLSSIVLKYDCDGALALEPIVK